VFGDSRELYIQTGSNTNGGVPGKISGSQLQKENYFSAATLVAHIHDPSFNGTITYDALDDGAPNSGSGVEIYCSGNRNNFGIVLHSNGHLYATDNGPNFGYGTYIAGATCDANCYDRVNAYFCVDHMCMYAPLSV
jgi:glucose/arabinose dehydrogenase